MNRPACAALVLIMAGDATWAQDLGCQELKMLQTAFLASAHQQGPASQAQRAEHAQQLADLYQAQTSSSCRVRIGWEVIAQASAAQRYELALETAMSLLSQDLSTTERLQTANYTISTLRDSRGGLERPEDAEAIASVVEIGLRGLPSTPVELAEATPFQPREFAYAIPLYLVRAQSMPLPSDRLTALEAQVQALEAALPRFVQGDPSVSTDLTIARREYILALVAFDRFEDAISVLERVPLDLGKRASIAWEVLMVLEKNSTSSEGFDALVAYGRSLQDPWLTFFIANQADQRERRAHPRRDGFTRDPATAAARIETLRTNLSALHACQELLAARQRGTPRHALEMPAPVLVEIELACLLDVVEIGAKFPTTRDDAMNAANMIAEKYPNHQYVRNARIELGLE